MFENEAGLLGEDKVARLRQMALDYHSASSDFTLVTGAGPGKLTIQPTKRGLALVVPCLAPCCVSCTCKTESTRVIPTRNPSKLPTYTAFATLGATDAATAGGAVGVTGNTAWSGTLAATLSFKGSECTSLPVGAWRRSATCRWRTPRVWKCRLTPG